MSIFKRKKVAATNTIPVQEDSYLEKHFKEHKHPYRIKIDRTGEDSWRWTIQERVYLGRSAYRYSFIADDSSCGTSDSEQEARTQAEIKYAEYMKVYRWGQETKYYFPEES